jgi:proton-translocating NAD(P)+ transhydrogenase
VSLTPQNAALLLKKGFKRVLVESGAGHEAKFPDEAYAKAGATVIPSKDELYDQSDVLLKVRPPSVEETEKIREGTTLISYLYPAQNKPIVDALQKRKMTAMAMDLIPRTTRGQEFDALRFVPDYPTGVVPDLPLPTSSMGNLAGYKAVLEASNHFGALNCTLREFYT